MFPSGECYMRDVQCERAGCHSERPPSMKPPSCGACGGHPIPNICAKPFGVGWRLCASEQRVGAFEGCRSAHDHFGFAHSCLLPPSPRRGPVDGTDSAPTKSLQARQVGRRGVSDSLKLEKPQHSTTSRAQCKQAPWREATRLIFSDARLWTSSGRQEVS